MDVIFGPNGSAFGRFMNSDVLNSVFGSGFYMPGKFLGNASDFMGQAGRRGRSGRGVPGAVAGPAATRWKLRWAASGHWAIRWGWAEGGSLGPLSVPPSWATPPAAEPAVLGVGARTDGRSVPTRLAGSTPPVPMANMGGRGEGRAIPQYGFRPSFVARPPAAG